MVLLDLGERSVHFLLLIAGSCSFDWWVLHLRLEEIRAVREVLRNKLTLFDAGVEGGMATCISIQLCVLLLFLSLFITFLLGHPSYLLEIVGQIMQLAISIIIIVR